MTTLVQPESNNNTTPDRKHKTVCLSVETYNAVKKFGRYGDSFTKIIDHILADYSQRLAAESEAARGVF